MLYIKRKNKSFIFFMLEKKPMVEGFGIKFSDKYEASEIFFERKLKEFICILHSVYVDFKVEKIVLAHDKCDIRVFEKVRKPYPKWIRHK